MCPMVPIFTWGFFRSYFFLAIESLRCCFISIFHQSFKDMGGGGGVVEELHVIITPPLGYGTKARRIAEHFSQREVGLDVLYVVPVVNIGDPAPPRAYVAD